MTIKGVPMNSLSPPDIATQTATARLPLEWVGMAGIALLAQQGLEAFSVRVVHAESLHAHDAVAQSGWRRAGD